MKLWVWMHGVKKMKLNCIAPFKSWIIPRTYERCGILVEKLMQTELLVLIRMWKQFKEYEELEKWEKLNKPHNLLKTWNIIKVCMYGLPCCFLEYFLSFYFANLRVAAPWRTLIQQQNTQALCQWWVHWAAGGMRSTQPAELLYFHGELFWPNQSNDCWKTWKMNKDWSGEFGCLVFLQSLKEVCFMMR